MYRGRNLDPPPGDPPQTVTDILECSRIVGWEEEKFGLPPPFPQTVTDRVLLGVTDCDRQTIIKCHRP